MSEKEGNGRKRKESRKEEEKGDKGVPIVRPYFYFSIHLKGFLSSEPEFNLLLATNRLKGLGLLSLPPYIYIYQAK